MPVFRIIYSGTERYLELICKLGIFVNGESKAFKLIKITKSLFQWKNEILGERNLNISIGEFIILRPRDCIVCIVCILQSSHMFLAPRIQEGGGGHLWQQQQCLVIRLRAHKEGESPGLEDKQENCPTDPGREYNTPKAKHCFIFTESLEARAYFLIFQNLFVTASSTARSFDTWLIDSMHCRCSLPIQYGVHRQGSWKLIYFDGSSNESSQERPS